MGTSETDRDQLRVMTYSHDGYGMGHLRRNLNIATRLVETIPECSVLMLVGCSSGAYFDLKPGIDFIKVPSIIKVAAGVHEPLSLRISLQRAKALRNAMIQRAAEVFSPNLVLVDHVPAGVWQELIPTLEMLKAREDSPTIVFGVRDILDSPEVIREQWQHEGSYELIDRYYDAVLVYGCQAVFDTASEYGLAVRFGDKIRYCGYVCSDEPYRSREQTRVELGIGGDEKLIVVTGGGGRDVYPIMKVFIDALRLIASDLSLAAVLIAGPLMALEQKESLREQARGLKAHVLSHVHDSLSYLNAADFVVTMGGYNSLGEVLRLEKKALVVPRLGPSAEQTMRSRIFAQRGLIDILSPQQLSVPALAERIVVDLERTDYPRSDLAIDTGGRARAVLLLKELNCKRVLNGA